MAIARAMLFEAPLLLLDEPTSNLDHVNEQKLMDAIRSLGSDTTIVYVTHSAQLSELATTVLNLGATSEK